MSAEPTAALLPYRALAHNNAWANHRLLTACAALSQEEFTARRTSFFPSLRATLNHILVIDRFYVDAMEGGTLGPAAWADPEPCSTVAALRQAQAEVDLRLLAVIDRTDEAGLGQIVTVHRGTRVQHERAGPASAAPVPTPDPSPGAGARHAERDFGSSPSTRRVLLGERGSVASRRIRRARLDGSDRLGSLHPRAEALTPDRHSGASRNPSRRKLEDPSLYAWMPAFAGMTRGVTSNTRGHYTRRRNR
jgi:uncharacterized damage-inducible protein DinB